LHVRSIKQVEIISAKVKRAKEPPAPEPEPDPGAMAAFVLKVEAIDWRNAIPSSYITLPAL
jgi:hypothetical protein